MPKFIEKNGDYYLRKSYDLGLKNEALELLKDIEIDQDIDEDFFKYLCDNGYVAFLHEGTSNKPMESDLGSNTELFNHGTSDSLRELVSLVARIEQCYEKIGIHLEIKITTKSNS
jgi:hypothetical protein